LTSLGLSKAFGVLGSRTPEPNLPSQVLHSGNSIIKTGGKLKSIWVKMRTFRGRFEVD